MLFHRKKSHESPRDTDATNEGREAIITIAIGLLFALTAVFLGDLLLPEPIGAHAETSRILFKVFLGLHTFLLGAFATAYVFEHFWYRKRYYGLSTELRSLTARMERLAEHTTLYSDNHELQKNALDLLREKTNGPMWIVARFISRQLATSFKELRFHIDGDAYSTFSQHLYQECSNSIYLTSPFSPLEWVKQLYGNRAADMIDRLFRGDANAVEALSSEHLPPHVRSLLSAPAPDKKRLVVIERSRWPSLLAQERLLALYVTGNAGIETRFTTKEDLLESYPSVRDLDLTKVDCAIFDRQILLQWEMPTRPGMETPLRLVDLSNIAADGASTALPKIVEQIFEFRPRQHKTAAEVQDEITKTKRKLCDEVRAKNSLPHKLAYYGAGASRWNQIVADPAYDLGKQEVVALSRFLAETIGQHDQPWNVIHIGPGNGIEVQRVIAGLGINRVKTYGLVDISPDLLDIAAARAESRFDDVRFIKRTIDVTDDRDRELADLAKAMSDNGSPNLFLLIGNGAILSNADVYSTLRDCMAPRDRLLITLETYKEEREAAILEHYSVDSVVTFLTYPLFVLGVEPDTVRRDDLTYSYNKENAVVEVHFECEKWQKRLGRRVSFAKQLPARFRIFATFRPKEAELRNKLESVGFTVERMKCYEPLGCCGVLCGASVAENAL